MRFTERVSKSKWDRLVNKSKISSFYHTPIWAEILERSLNYQIATRLYEINGLEILLPLMRQKKGIFNIYNSMPYGYGGFISDVEIPDGVIDMILKNFASVRNLYLNISLGPFSDNAFKKVTPRMKIIEGEIISTHILSLDRGFDYIFNKKFLHKVRQNMRKAKRNRVKIVKGTSLSDYKRYYYIYLDTEKRHKTSNPLPLILFENIYNIASSDNVKLLLAKVNDKVIAGFLYFIYGDQAYAWNGASLSQYWKLRPNDLLYAEAIKETCEYGLKYINLGASAGSKGVQRFKENFGTERIDLKQIIVWSRTFKVLKTILRK